MNAECMILPNGETYCNRHGISMAPYRYAQGYQYCSRCATMFTEKKHCPCCHKQMRSRPAIGRLKEQYEGENGGLTRF